jgi:hypothetical protein
MKWIFLITFVIAALMLVVAFSTIGGKERNDVVCTLICANDTTGRWNSRDSRQKP